MSSPASRPAARCSSPRCAPPARSTGCRRTAAPRFAAGSKRWLDAQVDRHLRPLKKLAAAATDPASSPGVRALAAMLADAGGVLPRKAVLGAIAHLEQADRQALHRLRVRLGPLDVFLSSRCSSPPRSIGARRLLAVRTGQPMPALPARRRGDARPPTPTRAAPRSPTAGSAATGSASTSPTGSPATRARSARRAATIRSTASSRPRSASTTRRIAQADGRGRLHPRRRSLALARPPRRRAPTPRAPRSHAFAELAKLKRRREDRPLPLLHPAGEEPHPRAGADRDRPRPHRRQARREAERGGARRQRRRACRSTTRSASSACSACPSRRGPAAEARACYEELGIDEASAATLAKPAKGADDP